MGKWSIYDFENDDQWFSMPNAPGVYVIYADGKLIYIGQSTDVKKRLKSNHLINFARYSSMIETPWGRFTSLIIKIRTSDRYGDWAMHELRLIKRLQPPLNCVGSVKKRGSK